jgi:hypothetical protein
MAHKDVVCVIGHYGMNISAVDKNIVVNWATTRAPPIRVYEASEDTARFGIRFRWIA